jgi:acrylyl-CoA reductase (NADPH)
VSDSFRALVVSESQGTTSAELRQLTDEELPDGDVTVAVEFSSLNYKDGLALTGRVVRRFPLVPGVDLAGLVLRSDSDEFASGGCAPGSASRASCPAR